MLLMKPNCECCDRDLPADRAGAMICSFECTFCARCAEERLGGACPNCGGGFGARPARSPALWDRFPPSEARIIKPHKACVSMA